MPNNCAIRERARTPLLTAGEMADWERAGIASGRVTNHDMMERAGRGATDAALRHWTEFASAPHRAVVLCGPGNNGGDGFVVARLLGQRGWEVEALLLGDPARLPPDARRMHDAWAGMGTVRPLTDEAAAGLDPPDLCVDAILGGGLARPFDSLPGIRSWAAEARAAGTRLLAIDVPSGLSASTGRFLGGAGMPPADLTVTFQAPRVGHHVGDDAAACGALAVCDIGLDGPPPASAATLVEPDAAMARALGKGSEGHKYAHGHLVVLAGGFGRTGAARLAARAALRAGAGLVTLHAPGPALMECAAQLTAVILRRCDDAAALETALEDERLNALCLGPGLGLDERGAALTGVALASGRPAVIDADAITHVAGSAALRADLHVGCLLTPHAGEFARLCPDLSEALSKGASSIEVVRDAAARLGCAVLLKGAATVVASPAGAVRVNSALRERAAPWLATAGSGDVLAGIAAGLMARGQPPFEAGCAAAWLHAECARAFGPGLIAEDLPEMLPGVLSSLLDPA